MKDTSRNQSAELKHAGLKATGPRMKILEIFQEASLQGKRHMSADDVYKALLAEDMDVGLATVYRVLTQFETAGILIRHHFDTDYATFELDDGYHHDHLVCLKCGAVEEFVDREIEERQNEIAKRFGFKLESHSLSLYGICSACQKKEAERNKKREEGSKAPRIRLNTKEPERISSLRLFSYLLLNRIAGSSGSSLYCLSPKTRICVSLPSLQNSGA